MAEPETICEWLGIELDKLSDDDKMNLIGEIFEASAVPGQYLST